MIKNGTGWCYTMLQPVRSLPLSSDPVGYAKTKEKDRKRRGEKEKGVREIFMEAERVNMKLSAFSWGITADNSSFDYPGWCLGSNTLV